MSNLPMRIVVQRDLTARQARALTDRIKSTVGDLMILVAKAWQGRVWIALDYESWADYIKGEFSHAPLSLPREERRAVVSLLRGQGMSTRAIGSATGTDEKTVRNDLAGAEFSAPESEDVPITGLDGKSYTVTCTKPENSPAAPEAEQPAPEPAIQTRPEPTPAPGGLTPNTPGVTDRVKEALQHAKETPAPNPEPSKDDQLVDLVTKLRAMKRTGREALGLALGIHGFDQKTKRGVVIDCVDELRAVLDAVESAARGESVDAELRALLTDN